MSQDPLISFQRHLETQGKRPGTQDAYVGVLARFLRSVDLPLDSITAEHVYQHLVERGTAARLSRSWYNVIYHALVAWLEMQGLTTDLRGLRLDLRVLRRDQGDQVVVGQGEEGCAVHASP